MVQGSLEAYRQVVSSENKKSKNFNFWGVWGQIIYLAILGQKHILSRIQNVQANTVVDPLIPFNWSLFSDNLDKVYFTVHQVLIMWNYVIVFKKYPFSEKIEKIWQEFCVLNNSPPSDFKLNFSKLYTIKGFPFLDIQKEEKKCFQIDENRILPSCFSKNWWKFEKMTIFGEISLKRRKKQ